MLVLTSSKEGQGEVKISVNYCCCQLDNQKTLETVTCGGDLPIATITSGKV